MQLEISFSIQSHGYCQWRSVLVSRVPVIATRGQKYVESLPVRLEVRTNFRVTVIAAGSQVKCPESNATRG